MVVGAFIPGLRRRYPAHEYVSAMLLVVGLILFTLADANTSPNFSIIGVVMICGALIMDSILGNLQEAIFTLNPETTQTEMLFCSSVVGLPFLIPPMILTGELFKAWNSCSQVHNKFNIMAAFNFFDLNLSQKKHILSELYDLVAPLIF